MFRFKDWLLVCHLFCQKRQCHFQNWLLIIAVRRESFSISIRGREGGVKIIVQCTLWHKWPRLMSEWSIWCEKNRKPKGINFNKTNLCTRISTTILFFFWNFVPWMASPTFSLLFPVDSELAHISHLIISISL